MLTIISVPVLVALAAADPHAVEAPPSQAPTTVQGAGAPPPLAFPPPPPKSLDRGVSLSLSAGPGWLALRDDIGRDGQSAMSLGGRLGAALNPDWMLHFTADHTATKRGGSTFSQTALLLGLQRFLFQRLYLSAAAGLAWVRQHGPAGLTDGPGFAYSAALGAELMQSEHAAVTAELAFTMGHYQVEKWEMGGVRLGLSFF